MDISPENLNPDIVALARVNPALKEIINLYLYEIPVGDEEKPLTWMQATEMMVIKLAQQYGGALEGWKDSYRKAPAPVLALVNETEKPCPECKSLTWFIDGTDGIRKCALCDGRKGRRALVYQNQQLKKVLAQFAANDRPERIQKTLEGILKLEPNVPKL